MLFASVNCLGHKKQAPGKKLFGIAVNEASGEDFDVAFGKAKELGINFTTLAINWDDVERSKGKFNPEPNFLAIANQYYPANELPVALELNPIDTVKRRVPKDLSGIEFDDPGFVERYKAFLDWSFTQIPDLQLVSLTIGNEIDVYLGTDPLKWEQFRRFYSQVAAHAKTLRPGLKVGSKITLNGLTDLKEYAGPLNSETDVVLTTYYHLGGDFKVMKPETISTVFNDLVELYPDREIYFLEIGYPSGKLCGSSEQNQARFISEVFKGWDKHDDHIKVLNFTWLTDISPHSADNYEGYYGIDNKSFREFLSTIGLRTNSGKPKQALEILKTELEQRKMLK
ncbi:MAG: hypothetical protein HKN25_17695 [Pyrinomonadaceae bacterium]|nr:hypothetical protein [Pyrinomonadaceae bacterium]